MFVILVCVVCRIELKKQRERADKATASEQTATAAARNAKEDYQLLSAKYKTETAHLTSQVGSLTSQHVGVEETLRREFSAQLEQLLQDRLTQFQEEKLATINELKIAYEAKVASYRDSLESVGQDMERQKHVQERMATELSKANALAAEAIANRDALV